MCGRFILLSDKDFYEMMDIVDEIDLSVTKSGEIFPSDAVPIVVAKEDRNVLITAKWGYSHPKHPGLIINARSETLEDRPMFRNSFLTKRCLIPAHGFYEWKKEDRKKTKFRIDISDQEYFFMAGLYNTFYSQEKQPYTAFVVLTTSPCSTLSKIHDRMPVILEKQSLRSWLNGSPPEVKALLQPYHDHKIQLHEVG